MGRKEPFFLRDASLAVSGWRSVLGGSGGGCGGGGSAGDDIGSGCGIS